MSLFESEDGFSMLPGRLENLYLDAAASADMLARISFSKSLQESLQSLEVYVGPQDPRFNEQKVESLFSKLSGFSSLTKLNVSAEIIIKSTTLSSLPKTLLKLQLELVDFENLGLPVGQKIPDWKEGAL